MLSIIAALSNNKVIGNDNQLPWHLPADLKHFKSITMGKPIIMGRKTYESIGKPLPGRDNIIISRDPDYQANGCQVFDSITTAINSQSQADEVMIIGGASIYEQALPLVQRMYLTLIHQNIEGDAFFPEWDQQEWSETERTDHKADDNTTFDYSFITMNKK